jgi:hypothetical protein
LFHEEGESIAAFVNSSKTAVDRIARIFVEKRGTRSETAVKQAFASPRKWIFV